MKLFLVIVSFSFFVVCPRMAAITSIIEKSTHWNIYYIAIFGIVLSIPLTLAMIWIYKHIGLVGALVFAVATDIVSALLLSSVSWKSTLQTIIIAAFVLAGVKISEWLSLKLFPT